MAGRRGEKVQAGVHGIAGACVQCGGQEHGLPHQPMNVARSKPAWWWWVNKRQDHIHATGVGWQRIVHGLCGGGGVGRRHAAQAKGMGRVVGYGSAQRQGGVAGSAEQFQNNVEAQRMCKARVSNHHEEEGSMEGARNRSNHPVHPSEITGSEEHFARAQAGTVRTGRQRLTNMRDAMA